MKQGCRVLLGCACMWMACGDDAIPPIDATGSSSSGDAITSSTTMTIDPDSSGTTDGTSTRGTEGSDGTDTVEGSTGPGIVCGDGTAEGDELCDGDDLGDETCESQGLLGGRLACAADCLGFDTRGCTAAQCGNDAIEGDELCDGTDLADATCASEGFDNGTLACAADCSDLDVDGCGVCGNFIVEDAEACDGPLLFAQTCLTLGFDSGELACQPDCLEFDTTGCGTCGNDTIDGAELCDGDDFGGLGCATLGMGFDNGTLQCASTCDAYVTTACGTCGNGTIDGAETCDGTALAGQTCTSQGFDNGALGCQADCLGYDTSNCGSCGNGVVDGGEACDGELLGGQTCASLGLEGGSLSCTAACEYDVSTCDVAGTPFGSDGFYYGFAIDPAVLPCDEISATGVATGLSNDGHVLTPLGFTFDFYQSPFTEVAINANGTLYFGADATLGLANSCMPGNTPYLVDDDIVAVFWDDLDPEAAGEVYYQTLGTPGDQRFVVQWDVPNFGGSAVDLMRIQAVLHESGNIEVCYVDTVNGGDPGDSGAGATAGLQRDPTLGLPYSCNTPSLVDGRQLLYVPI